jgi:ribonuclease G
MSKEICISTTPHETRLAILENDELAEIYYERENEYTLAGSIYKGKVTRVLPGMQSAFVDIGLERDAFLYVTDFLEEQEDSEEFERTNLSGNQQRKDTGRNRQAQPEPETAPEASTPGREVESGDDDSPSGTRRWRGRRGRGRGVRRGRDNKEQETRIQDEPVEAGSEDVRYDAPASSSASASDNRVYENEATFERHAAPAATGRILLPGESLSRYGGTPAAETSKSKAAASPAFKPNYTAPKPSTLIDSPLTWDGGSLLPGESRTGKNAGTAAAPTAEVETESRAWRETTATEEVVVDTQLQAPVAAWPEHPTSEEHLQVEAHQETEQVETAAHDVAPTTEIELHPDVELQEEVHEFEPESAAASHRVETAAASEFRVSSVADPVIEEESLFAPTVEDETPLEVPEHDEQATEVADQLFGFAPGAGILEEEVIDEEEYDFEPIHALAGDEHDSEDLEEETLEHSGQEDAAESVGEFVREEHIDERLGNDSAIVEVEEAEADEEFETSDDEVAEGEVAADSAAPSQDRQQGGERRGRRGDRHGDRRGGGRLGRRQGRGGHRPSAQTMDLPIISDLLKQGQEILLQIAKEPIAKKGARVTSHIALPGRFLVFMPTVNHVGVSRKISSDEERQRLKRILISEKGDATGGFIVRTAADGAGEDELRADLRFLISLWNDIKQREESSKSPALIYHDLNLVERVLRDQVSDNFSTIWVDSESEYERIVRFLNRFQPSLVRRVKLYTKETPLFEQFGIQDEITKALKSKVWLKSGGSIVINQTEALVAIDINTGKYVGKTARLEDTILKTNLDAIPEIVRQIRLRDLGGIIVIDFIDMDERKNRHKVMAALEEALKADRAPSKVLQFNDFGLVAITRKRVKQSLERTLSIPCPVCTATGMVKSPTTVANEIYVEMRKMQKHLDRGDVMLRVNPEVVKVLKANNARWLNELEEMSGKTIIVKSDPALHPEQFDIH